MSKTCIFCKIIDKEASSIIVYEGENVIAFDTKNPVSKGHVLLVPREHAEIVTDMTDSQASELGLAMKKVSELVVEKNCATGLNILQANGRDAQQSVFHVHFHMIPRYKDDGLDLWIKQNL